MNSNKKNILDRLNKSDSGFNTPKGYFDEFEERLMSDLNQDTGFRMKNESEAQGPETLKSGALDQVEKNHGFKVPENYFEEDLSLKVLPEKSKIISLGQRNTRTWLSLAVAASFLLFFGLKFYTAPEKQLELADLKDDEIENWIDADLISFNTYEVAEAFYDVELETLMYSDEEVTDYLDQIDIEQLILDN